MVWPWSACRQAPRGAPEGRVFPIEYHYRPANRQQWLEPQVGAVVLEALASQAGSALRSCRDRGDRAAGTVAGRAVARDVTLAPSMAVLTSRPSRRPSSLRLRVVASWCSPPTWRRPPSPSRDLRGHRQRIGAARHLRYQERRHPAGDPPIAKASATQRAGRAGRLGPGVCYRLWAARCRSASPSRVPPTS